MTTPIPTPRRSTPAVALLIGAILFVVFAAAAARADFPAGAATRAARTDAAHARVRATRLSLSASGLRHNGGPVRFCRREPIHQGEHPSHHAPMGRRLRRTLFPASSVPSVAPTPAVLSAPQMTCRNARVRARNLRCRRARARSDALCLC